MTLLSKFLIGGAAVALVAGTTALAAPEPVVHHMAVMVPGYGTAQIAYAGKVAPRVTFRQGPFAWDAAAPLFDPPFAGFDRIAAEMDSMQAQMEHQMAVTLARVRALQNGTNGVYRANLSALPPGTQSYSMVTTIVGNKVCTRTTSLTGAGARSQLVSNTSGDCGPQEGSNGAAIRASTHTAPAHPDKTSI